MHRGARRDRADADAGAAGWGAVPQTVVERGAQPPGLSVCRHRRHAAAVRRHQLLHGATQDARAVHHAGGLRAARQGGHVSRRGPDGAEHGARAEHRAEGQRQDRGPQRHELQRGRPTHRLRDARPAAHRRRQRGRGRAGPVHRHHRQDEQQGARDLPQLGRAGREPRGVGLVRRVPLRAVARGLPHRLAAHDRRPQRRRHRRPARPARQRAHQQRADHAQAQGRLARRAVPQHPADAG